MKSQRILITGGTGFIGINLTTRLLKEGAKVYLFVRKKTSIRSLPEGCKNVQYLFGDITKKASIKIAVKKASPHIIFHLASTPFNPPGISASLHSEVIIKGTMNLLEALVGNRRVKIIGIGSAAEYGEGCRLTEDAPLLPRTILGAAKASATMMMQVYARLYQLNTIILRVFSPYGPWESQRRLIPGVILSGLNGRDVMMTNGLQERDYVYIDDLIEAMVLVGKKNMPPGIVLNICSGKGIKVRNVAKQLLKLMGNPVKIKFGAVKTRADEIWRCNGDNKKAKALLGWKPQTSLDAGLFKTLKWIMANRQMITTL